MRFRNLYFSIFTCSKWSKINLDSGFPPKICRDNCNCEVLCWKRIAQNMSCRGRIENDFSSLIIHFDNFFFRQISSIFKENFVPHVRTSFGKKLYPTCTPFHTFHTPFRTSTVGNPGFNVDKWLFSFLKKSFMLAKYLRLFVSSMPSENSSLNGETFFDIFKKPWSKVIEWSIRICDNFSSISFFRTSFYKKNLKQKFFQLFFKTFVIKDCIVLVD